MPVSGLPAGGTPAGGLPTGGVPAGAKLKMGLERLRAVYHRRKGQRDRLAAERERAGRRLGEVLEELEILGQVKALLQETSTFAREQARRRIEGMVTDALQYTFGSDLEFKVRVEELRGRPEAEFLVASTYGGDVRVENTPQDARGGGVVDVISLALRLALLEVNRPPLPGPIILDEPAKHVSEEFSLNVAQFLKGVSESFGRQVILVTHNAHLAGAGDVAYHVEMKEGRSVVQGRVQVPLLEDKPARRDLFGSARWLR